jgi:hypothetical protein
MPVELSLFLATFNRLGRLFIRNLDLGPSFFLRPCIHIHLPLQLHHLPQFRAVLEFFLLVLIEEVEAHFEFHVEVGIEFVLPRSLPLQLFHL